MEKYNMIWLTKIAKEKDLEISSDLRKVSGVLNGLNNTDGHCPCVPKFAHCDENKCPCVSMINDKHCICGLFKGGE